MNHPEAGGEFGAEGGGEIRHLLEVRLTVQVEMAEELAPAVGREAEVLGELDQLGAGAAVEVLHWGSR